MIAARSVPSPAASSAETDGGRRVAVDLGPLRSIPLGEGRSYRVGERTIAVFRPRDGGLHALDDRCPHRGGPLADGIVGGGVVICPLHGWKLSLESGRTADGAGCVRTYPVAPLEDRIVLFLEEER